MDSLMNLLFLLPNQKQRIVVFKYCIYIYIYIHICIYILYICINTHIYIYTYSCSHHFPSSGSFLPSFHHVPSRPLSESLMAPASKSQRNRRSESAMGSLKMSCVCVGLGDHFLLQRKTRCPGPTVDG